VPAPAFQQARAVFRKKDSPAGKTYDPHMNRQSSNPSQDEMPPRGSGGATTPGVGAKSRRTQVDQRLRVLIVDDNRDAADSLAMLFGLLACETRVAYDGQQGASEAVAFQPDMAVLDISMPVMDGYQLAERLRRELPEHTPMLVALTALTSERDKAEARRVGFDHHLSKPVDSASLCHLVMRAIARRQQH